MTVRALVLLALLAAPSVCAAQTSAAPPPPDQPPTRPLDVEEPDPVRLRFGIALDGDLLAADGLVGLGIGLTARLGVQLNQWFGLYYQPHGIVGGWLSESAGGVIASLFNSVNAELTLPFFHIGAGPSLDVLAVAGCSADGCLSGDAVFFGIDTRLAVVIGAIGRGSRGGFSINAHLHPTFVGDLVVLTATLGVGGEVY